MASREEFIQDTLGFLKSIQSLDDVNANKDKIIQSMQQALTTAIEELREFNAKLPELSPEERNQQGAKFMNEDYLMPPEFMNELERIDAIPGVQEKSDLQFDAIQEQMEPFLAQYQQEMTKLSDALAGEVFGSMEAAMKEAVESMAEGMGGQAAGEETEEQEEEQYEFDPDNPETPEILYDLYMSRTLAGLEENKDRLMEYLEEDLQSHIWDLEVLTDMDPGEWFEQDKEKIETIRHLMERLEPEMEKEFARLAALPDAAEAVAKIKQEVSEKIGPKVSEVNKYLGKLG